MCLVIKRVNLYVIVTYILYHRQFKLSIVRMLDPNINSVCYRFV